MDTVYITDLIKKNIHNNTNYILNNIKKSTEYILLNKSNLFKIRRKINEDNNNVYYESKLIPADNYIKFLVQSIENIYSLDDGKINKYIDNYNFDASKYIFYERLNRYKELSGGINYNETTHCSIDIRINYDNNTLSFTDETGKFNTISYKVDYDEDLFDEDDEMDEATKKEKEIYDNFMIFCEYLYNRINKCGSFMNIMLSDWSKKSDTGHRNMVLIENLKDKIVFNHYEPHGSSSTYYKDERKYFFDLLNKYFNLYYQKKYLKISRNARRKPIYKTITIKEFNASICLGIQTKLNKYDIGYCTIFSFFWLYAVLTIYFRLKKYTIEYNINMWTITDIALEFEKYIVNLYKNDDELLYNIIITFGFKLFEEYLKSDIITKDNIKTLDNIQNIVVDSLWGLYPLVAVDNETWKKEQTYNITNILNYFKIKDEELEDENINLTLMDKEYEEIINIFPNLYKSCKSNKDCNDHNLTCNYDEETDDNICMHNTKKTLYKYCKTNTDCFSNNCVNNICTETSRPVNIYNPDKQYEISQKSIPVMPLDLNYNNEEPQEIYIQNIDNEPQEFNIQYADNEPEEFEIQNIDNEPQEFEIQNIDNEPQEFEIQNIDNEPQEFEIQNIDNEPQEFEIQYADNEPQEFEIQNMDNEPQEFEIQNIDNEPEEFNIQYGNEEPEEFNIQYGKY